ncbi:unnamed protein product, partial [Closterium sp. NIES-53]
IPKHPISQLPLVRACPIRASAHPSLGKLTEGDEVGLEIRNEENVVQHHRLAIRSLECSSSRTSHLQRVSRGRAHLIDRCSSRLLAPPALQYGRTGLRCAPSLHRPCSSGCCRTNRTILETARALLIESGVGNSMWPHAVRHATVARNRVLTKVGNELWVPLERWLGRKPRVDMLRVFGCMAVAHVPKKYRSKLGASAIWCVHLGLAAESKGWLLWEPSKGVLFDSRDVKFVEGMMYGGWKKQPEIKVSQQMEQITMQLDLTPSVWEEGEEAAAEGGDGEKVQEAPGGGGDDVETSDSTKGAAGSEGGEQQLGKAKVPALPSRRKPKGVLMRGWETPVSRPGRTRMATMKLTAGADIAEEQLGNEEALLILPHGYDPDEEDEPAYFFLAPAPEEPASMEEALAGPDREKWLVSRDAEYQSLLENGTWDLVNPSEEQVDAAERVVKYLNSHPRIGVQYSASAQVNPFCINPLAICLLL